MANTLSDAEVEKALESLPGWTVENHKLVKTYERKDFADAVSFIVGMGFVCEQQDHHPELYNVWNKVRLEITTHDAGNKLTEKDISLASAIEKIAGGS